MTLQPFSWYLQRGRVKKRTPDPVEARSLLRKAAQRLAYAKQKALTPSTAAFVLEDAYEAAREAAQALLSAAGYKPYSHEATISFLQAFHSPPFTPAEIADFDRFRQLRHDSVYKAVPVLPADATDCLRFAARTLPKVRRLLNPPRPARVQKKRPAARKQVERFLR